MKGGNGDGSILRDCNMQSRPHEGPGRREDNGEYDSQDGDDEGDGDKDDGKGTEAPEEGADADRSDFSGQDEEYKKGVRNNTHGKEKDQTMEVMGRQGQLTAGVVEDISPSFIAAHCLCSDCKDQGTNGYNRCNPVKNNDDKIWNNSNKQQNIDGIVESEKDEEGGIGKKRDQSTVSEDGVDGQDDSGNVQTIVESDISDDDSMPSDYTVTRTDRFSSTDDDSTFTSL